KKRLVLAECPGALVGVLGAFAVVPGVEIGIGIRFLEFVSEHRNHAVYAGVSVRADGLRTTGVQTAIGVADERVLNVCAADCAIGMPSAVLSAQTGFRNVGGGDDEVHAVRVFGEGAVGDRVAHNCGDVS